MSPLTTYFIINSSTKGHYIGRPGVIGVTDFYKIGQMRTKRRGCAFHFVEIFQTSWKFSLYFVHIFRTDWNFFTKLDSSDPSIKTILTLQYLKLETSVHARIAIVHYYVCLQFPWQDMNLKVMLGKPYWLIKLVNSGFFNLIMWLLPKNVFWPINFDCRFAKFVTSKSQLYGSFKCWHFY